MKNLKYFLLIFLFLPIFISNCVIPGKATFKENGVMIEGYVDFELSPKSPLLGREGTLREGTSTEFTIKAKQADIATDSTVSLLYPPDYSEPALKNITIATGKTNSAGYFTINKNPDFIPVAGEIFILEAIKRTGNNIALRTILRYNGDSFDSITTPKIVINSATTALSLIASLRPDKLNTIDTIGKFTVTDNQVEIADVNPDVTIQTVSEINKLVEQSIAANYDPVAVIAYQQDKYIININGKNPLLVGCSGDCSNIPTLLTPGPAVIPTQVPFVPPVLSNNRIVYSGYDSEYNSDIYSVKADGTGLIKLTNEGQNTNPVAFDSGKKIAYQKNYYQLYIMNSDGTGLERYFPEGNEPNYNIDSGIGRDGQISCSTNDGTGICDRSGNLIYSFVEYYPFVRISPDGTKLLAHRYDGVIELVDITNGERRIVLSDIQYSYYDQMKVSWSQDSSKALLKLPDYPSADVYIVRADGTGITQLPSPNSNIAQGIFDASWSLDNRKIVFVTKSEINDSYGIAEMKEDGTGLKILSTQLVKDLNNSQGIFKPKWSIDGKTILFNALELSIGLTYVLSPDGKYIKNVAYAGSADWIEVNQ